jgi:predicted DNA-binding transcriptional regulator AlpA
MLPLEGTVRMNQLLGLGSFKNQPAVLPITRMTLYAWIEQGLWPKPMKVGGVLLWSAATVREALARFEESQ